MKQEILNWFIIKTLDMFYTQVTIIAVSAKTILLVNLIQVIINSSRKLLIFVNFERFTRVKKV